MCSFPVQPNLFSRKHLYVVTYLIIKALFPFYRHIQRSNALWNYTSHIQYRSSNSLAILSQHEAIIWSTALKGCIIWHNVSWCQLASGRPSGQRNGMPINLPRCPNALNRSVLVGTTIFADSAEIKIWILRITNLFFNPLWSKCEWNGKYGRDIS